MESQRKAPGHLRTLTCLRAVRIWPPTVRPTTPALSSSDRSLEGGSCPTKRRSTNDCRSPQIWRSLKISCLVKPYLRPLKARCQGRWKVPWCSRLLTPCQTFLISVNRVSSQHRDFLTFPNQNLSLRFSICCSLKRGNISLKSVQTKSKFNVCQDPTWRIKSHV